MRFSVSLRFAHFKARNLLLQRGHVPFQFLHVLFQEVLVLFKHETAFAERSRTLAAQLSKAHHLCARHACIPQSDEQVDPGKIVLCIAAMAVLSPPDWFKQPDALIVTQSIDAQPRLLSNLLNSQSSFHTTSIEPGVDSRSRGWIRYTGLFSCESQPDTEGTTFAGCAFSGNVAAELFYQHLRDGKPQPCPLA